MGNIGGGSGGEKRRRRRWWQQRVLVAVVVVIGRHDALCVCMYVGRCVRMGIETCVVMVIWAGGQAYFLEVCGEDLILQLLLFGGRQN